MVLTRLGARKSKFFSKVLDQGTAPSLSTVMPAVRLSSAMQWNLAWLFIDRVERIVLQMCVADLIEAVRVADLMPQPACVQVSRCKLHLKSPASGKCRRLCHGSRGAATHHARIPPSLAKSHQSTTFCVQFSSSSGSAAASSSSSSPTCSSSKSAQGGNAQKSAAIAMAAAAARLCCTADASAGRRFHLGCPTPCGIYALNSRRPKNPLAEKRVQWWRKRRRAVCRSWDS